VTTARRIIALLTALFLFPLIAVTTANQTASAADDAALFTPLAGFRQPAATQASVRPTAFKAYRVDLAGVRAQLAGEGASSLTIPAPTGEALTFDVAEDPVLDAAGQAAYPEIKTYAGHGPDGSSIRLDVTPLGFHAMVRRADGIAWYIDPAEDRAGEDRVVSYFGAAVPPAAREFVEREAKRAGAGRTPGADKNDFAAAPGGIVSTRTYRLAFLSDPTYAAHFGGTDVLVLAAKTALINRVNEVYNDDLAIHFTLDSSPKLNLDTAAEATVANGPCGASACFTAGQLASCGGSTLTRTTFVLGQLLGADTFDIGHIGLGVNGGGIAGLGVVGGTRKAEGCTGLPTPDGDFYAIDYVAHEMGHQMGGDHTFNGITSNCSTSNRNGPTSVEPGSGSSIMAYAGICGSDNLQPHSDPYFSFRSIDEINATTAAAATNLNERQVVNFTGLDVGEQFTLSCTSCPTSSAVNFTGIPATDSVNIAAAVAAATSAATISAYDNHAGVDSAGFTANWASTSNIPTLTVQVVSGAFTSFTGTLRNGGPSTNSGTVAATADHSPVVTVPADKTIPKQTPFTLTGSATDAEAGDTLTYLWEQTDSGPAAIGGGTGLVSNTKPNGPLFRQFGTAAQVSASDTLLFHSPGENLAGTSPGRTFPDLTQVVAGNTNAASGTCPAGNVDCFSEFLPTTAWVGTGDRVMHFRLTARDEFTPDAAVDHAGGVSWANMALTIDPTA
jgi:Metallo-peptidase family M12B Reprolysin-like